MAVGIGTHQATDHGAGPAPDTAAGTGLGHGDVLGLAHQAAGERAIVRVKPVAYRHRATGLAADDAAATGRADQPADMAAKTTLHSAVVGQQAVAAVGVGTHQAADSGTVFARDSAPGTGLGQGDEVGLTHQAAGEGAVVRVNRAAHRHLATGFAADDAAAIGIADQPAGAAAFTSMHHAAAGRHVAVIALLIVANQAADVGDISARDRT